MHYYNNNIADFRKDTTHLTLLEQGIYRRLMDQYYLDESPLCLDHATLMRSHCVRNADEIQAFENVLKDFFVRTEEGYIHKRCDIEIEAFHAKSKSASESAKARWERLRKEKEADAMRTHSDGNANHKPRTINQEPISLAADKSAPRKKGSRLPDDWSLPLEWGKWAFKNGLADNSLILLESEKFRDFWIGKAGKDAVKLDWEATWRNWVRNCKAATNCSSDGSDQRFKGAK